MASDGKEASVLTGTAPRGLLLASCSGESCGICGGGRRRKEAQIKNRWRSETADGKPAPPTVVHGLENRRTRP